jgi:hypothetical protein
VNGEGVLTGKRMTEVGMMSLTRGVTGALLGSESKKGAARLHSRYTCCTVPHAGLVGSLGPLHHLLLLLAIIVVLVMVMMMGGERRDTKKQERQETQERQERQERQEMHLDGGLWPLCKVHRRRLRDLGTQSLLDVAPDVALTYVMIC